MEQRFREAIPLLKEASEQLRREDERAQALGLLGSAHEALGEWAAASVAFQDLLSLEPAGTPYIQWHLAKAYLALGEKAQAAQTLANLPLENLPPAHQAEFLEELAKVRRQLGDYKGALEAYERILSFARQENYRALILEKRGETLLEAGREKEALAQFREVIQQHPRSYAAYLALQMLDAQGAAQLTELERGKILYYARQYGPCIQALSSYLNSQPDGGANEAHYYLGLAYEALGQFPQAFQQYDVLIERHPEDPLTPKAWMAKARAAAAYGGDPSGIYREFWRHYPGHPQAPLALWLAGQASERNKAWSLAAEFYHQLYTLYPQDEHVPEARFREGLMAYAQGQKGTALELWQAISLEGLAPEQRARLLTWKGLATQEKDLAQELWQKAYEASPWSYYGLRARDLLQGGTLRIPADVSPLVLSSALNAADWRQLQKWARALNEEAPGLSASQRNIFRQGEMLWKLGWYDKGLEVLRFLQSQVREDPPALLELAHLADELGAHPITLYCADRLIYLSGGISQAPRALLQLAYPTTFGHLVQREAERWAVDPLLFLALVRQESRFNPRAVSHAGAVGLTQVMPETGHWIAARLGAEEYHPTLLERPFVSVRYGVWYLGTLLNLYARDWFAALVAYNAGPGNLKRWTGGQAIADPDLFYETLPSSEAKSYLGEIYCQYRVYESLYRP